MSIDTLRNWLEGTVGLSFSGMSSTPPDWTVHSTGLAPTLPDVEGGRVVAVVASGRAVAHGWPAQAAVDLAAGWRSQGMRVVLADAGVERPTLHDVVGVSNSEGLTDAVVFGASPRRVARPVGDGGILFACAGTAVGDVASVFQAARWASLVGAFRQAGATLVLYLPEPGDAEAGVLASADDLVVLGQPGDEVPGGLAGDQRVRALRYLPNEAPQPSDEPEDPLDPLAVDPLAPGHPTPTQAAEAPQPSGAVPDAPPREPPATADAPDDPKAGRRGMALRVLGAVVLLSVVSAVAYQVWGTSEPPPPTPVQTTAPAAPAAGSTPEVQPEAELISPLRGFSVTLASFRDQASADERRRELEARVPRGLLYTAPVLVGGTEYHRLLLGPAPDSAGAASLAEEVGEALNADAGSWVVRATPLAYHLGEFPSLEDAGAEVTRWQGEGIPVYVLSVMYSDSTRGFRVYAGAYEDAAEAEYLGRLLAAAGARSTPLIPRVGTLPAG